MRFPGLRCALFALITLTLTACSENRGQYRHSLFVFGTLAEITLSDTTAGQAESAFLEIEKHFHLLHSQWTPWQQSDLSEVNAAIAEGKAFIMPGSLRALVSRSQQYSTQSDGLFNPAIGELIKLWQFNRHDDPDLRPPAQQDIDAFLRAAPDINDIKQDGDLSKSSNPHVDLNFGAFAKGVAVDWATDYLHAVGIDNAIVNTGGDLAVIGSNLSSGSAKAWNIGILHPRQQGVIASIEVADGEAVFTSGDYERYYVYEGKRLHHILDPRTGYPATGVRSVTVIDTDAGKADAAATALFIAGTEHWHRIARQMNIGFVMLIDDTGTVHMNPAMAARARFKVTPKPPIVVSEPL